MTTITFFRTDGILYGFDVSGHTGYAEEGSDVLCASISALTMFVINAITDGFGSPAEYSVDEKTTRVHMIARDALASDDAGRQFAVSRIIGAYRDQLREIAKDYRDFLQVREVEKDLR